MVKSIEAPDRATVVFRLQHPSPSFLSNMAHPANFIYAKKYLDSDVQYYKTHTVGTGPFKLKNYTRGSIIELERNPTIGKRGCPIWMASPITDAGHALWSGRVDIELRNLPPAMWMASRRSWAIKW